MTDQQRIALELAGIAENYSTEIMDHYTRQAIQHLTSALRELIKDS